MTTSTARFERNADADQQAFRLQATFRVLLDAMARPGEVQRLFGLADEAALAARAGLMPATMLLADALLDSATSLAVTGEEGARGAFAGASVPCVRSRPTQRRLRGCSRERSRRRGGRVRAGRDGRNA